MSGNSAMNPHQLSPDRRISNAVRPAIEYLEERMFFSVAEPALPAVAFNTATLRHGTLLVEGSNKSDNIVISLAPEGHGTMVVNINGKLAGKFALSSVNIVRAYGLSGSD